MNRDTISTALANETLSLKKLSQETKTPYSTLLRAIHAPVAGQAYDPDAVNMDAIETALKLKMGAEAFAMYDFEALIEENSGSATLDLTIGNKITIKRGGGLRDVASIYTIVFVTATHVVLDSDTSTEPRVVGIKTLKLFGAQPVEVEAADVPQTPDAE